MARKRILVIDDETDLVELIKTELEAAGYEILVSLDGQNGIQKALLDKPDLIVLDVMMPVMSGYEVLAQLRGNERTKGVPVIILSAKGETHSILDLQKLGATDYLIKPFESEDLLTTIQRYLGGNQNFEPVRYSGSP